MPAVLLPADALDLDDAMLETAINANLLSAVRLVRASVPAMRANGWGRICCITSYSVVQPIPALALSNTARAGCGRGPKPRPRTWPPKPVASP